MDAAMLERCPASVQEYIVTRKYPAGEVLLLQGEREQAAHLLLDGAVRVFKLLPDGAYFEIGRFEAVNFIGNIELFAKIGTMNMVETASECTVASIPLDAFYTWVDSDPILCRALLEDMAKQIVVFNTQVMIGRALPKWQHFWLLLIEADRSGREITKQHLAAMLSVSPRTVSRFLKKATEEGLVETRGGRICLTDRRRAAEEHGGIRPEI